MKLHASDDSNNNAYSAIASSHPHVPSLHWRFPAQGSNPIITPGQLHGGLDHQRAGAAQVLDMGDHYRMYYWGTGDLGHVILMAEADKQTPTQWRPRGGVLLAPQPQTILNATGPSFPHVFKVDGDRWHMIFCAWGQKLPTGRLANTTGLAISDDAGLTWRYHNQHPILAMDRPYDHSATGSVWVTKVNSHFRMYYTAIGDWFDRPSHVKAGHGDSLPAIGIGYATSDDGVIWHKPTHELLIAPRYADAEPYEYIVSKPCVIAEPSGFGKEGNEPGWRMFVSTFGHAYRTRSLISHDGLSWTHVPSPIEGELGVGQAGSFDDHQRSYASVVRHEGEYRMWYTGNRFGLHGMGYCTAAIKSS